MSVRARARALVCCALLASSGCFSVVRARRLHGKSLVLPVLAGDLLIGAGASAASERVGADDNFWAWTGVVFGLDLLIAAGIEVVRADD